MKETPQPCKRLRLTIGKEHYYLAVGKDFFHVTCPRENDPNMSQTREALEVVSQEVNKILKEFSDEALPNKRQR